MRSVAVMARAAVAVAAMISGQAGSFVADASPEAVALNGTFRATSDGAWAKLNQQFHDMETVTSTWTVTTVCSSSVECSGQVVSDQGWQAPVKFKNGLWLVTRVIESWERCSDGAVVSGRQQLKFYRVDDNNLRGWEETTGPSGACGNNEWLFVEMPFNLVRGG